MSNDLDVAAALVPTSAPTTSGFDFLPPTYYYPTSAPASGLDFLPPTYYYPTAYFTDDDDDCYYYNDCSDNYDDDDTNVGLIIICLVVFLLLLALGGFTMRAHQRSNQQSESLAAMAANTTTTGGEGGSERDVRVAARREASRRRAEELLAAPSSLIQNLSLEDRMDFISNVLTEQKYEAPERGTCSSSRTLDTGSEDLANSSQRECCAICLDPFEEMDTVCSSHNQNCIHSFHRECIYEWLLRHEDCPICRRDYLSFESVRGGKDVEVMGSTETTVPISAPPEEMSGVDTESGNSAILESPPPTAPLAGLDASQESMLSI